MNMTDQEMNELDEQDIEQLAETTSYQAETRYAVNFYVFIPCLNKSIKPS